MKIVCMIGTPAYLHHFVNRIGAHFPIDLVIREDAHTSIPEKIWKKGIFQSLKIIIARLRNKARFEQDYESILGNSWRKISGSTPVFTTGNINSEAVAQKLREIQPDLILVHGTSLIQDKTLAGMPLALNLHWGLSPYYKGSFCTEWALINSDTENIGYTIHRISAKIDGGDILTQERISIGATDTANRINMRLTRDGTAKMLEVIAALAAGRDLHFKQQDSAAGRLYLVKHFTDSKRMLAAYFENEKNMQDMLDEPSRPALPIQR